MPDSSQLPKFKMQPINGRKTGLNYKKKSWFYKFKKSKNFTLMSLIIAVVFGAIAGCVIWYNVQLRPIDNNDDKLTLVTIESGTTSTQIGKLLQEKSIIRSSFAFDIYIFSTGKSPLLKAGTYRLSSGNSIPEIVKHLTNGSVDTFDITFYPGATLADNTDNKNKYDVTTVLSNAGYSIEEIETGLNATYSGELFDGKPSDADLEGYVYGDTYTFNTGVTVEEILQKTFDEFYEKIEKSNILQKFSNEGLNLYEAITLASIIQREVSSTTGVVSPSIDQRQVAQVFLTRLGINMSLGSDVTYQYICDKLGVERNPDIDSAYNTRKYTGLPPGPISVPDITALEAVADPADTNYLYFLSGDDGKIYYSETYDGHQQNIDSYCQKGCSQL